MITAAAILDQIERKSAAAQSGRALVAKRRQLLKLLAERSLEGLMLYRPLPHLAGFHECRAKWRIVGGSNRSGKTECCTAETARVLCGCDPFDKYPKTNGKALVIAHDEDAIAMLWRKIASPGEFKIIQDRDTGLWRAVRPDPADPTQIDPEDLAYREKWRDAPPFLPPRMIRSIAWECPAKGVPRVVETNANWTMLMRSAGGAAKPPQGDNYHYAHIDEQLGNPDFFEETSRGLVQVTYNPRHIPRGVWSATAQVTNPQLLDLEEVAEKGGDSVAVFNTTILQNPYVSPEERQAFWDTLPPDQREVRFHGHRAIEGRRIYDYRPMSIHGCEPFEIPPNWCVYAVVDPGREHCGNLLAAVDPEERHVFVFDAWEVRKAGAMKWASVFQDHLNGRVVEAIIMDQRAGRQRAMGQDHTVAHFYREAMDACDIQPRRYGPPEMSGFFPGPDNVAAREEALIAWLQVRCVVPGIGTPKLQIVRGCSPELDRQIVRANNVPKPGGRLRKETRDTKQAQDLLVCLEYLAGFDPHYYSPPQPKEAEVSLWDEFQATKSFKQRGESLAVR